MRRILCFLLAMSILASQGPCWAHAHHGAHAIEHGEHAARPHLHFGHHHEHKNHDDHLHSQGVIQTPTEGSVPQVSDRTLLRHDHEADAVYFDPSVVVVRGFDVVTLRTSPLVYGVVVHLLDQEDRPACTETTRSGRLLCVGIACPVYLRKLSLRL